MPCPIKGRALLPPSLPLVDLALCSIFFIVASLRLPRRRRAPPCRRSVFPAVRHAAVVLRPCAPPPLVPNAAASSSPGPARQTTPRAAVAPTATPTARACWPETSSVATPAQLRRGRPRPAGARWRGRPRCRRPTSTHGQRKNRETKNMKIYEKTEKYL